jgi:hypothetical protein
MASTDYSTSVLVAAKNMAPDAGTRDAERNGSVAYTVSPTNYYAMRAIDPDAGSLTYRTWVVYGSPDTTAALYTGTRSGASALTNVVVVASWSVNN